MAARKPKAKTAATPKDKQPAGRVAKRPARGFHRFKNGALNVTPKGAEKNLVKENQDSPLLRLPPEIRTMIWKYALGGHELHVYRKGPYQRGAVRFSTTTGPVQSRLALNLLCVCRQIYTETYFVPFENNVFDFSYWIDKVSNPKYLRSYQKAAITDLKITARRSSQGAVMLSSQFKLGTNVLTYFRNLQRVAVTFGNQEHLQEGLEGILKTSLYALFGRTWLWSKEASTTDTMMIFGGKSTGKKT